MTFTEEDVKEGIDMERNVNGKTQHSTPWKDFDVVFLAALVGIDTCSKLAILKELAKRLKPGTLVVARSAHGLRSVLYPVSLRALFEVAEVGRSNADVKDSRAFGRSDEVRVRYFG